MPTIPEFRPRGGESLGAGLLDASSTQRAVGRLNQQINAVAQDLKDRANSLALTETQLGFSEEMFRLKKEARESTDYGNAGNIFDQSALASVEKFASNISDPETRARFTLAATKNAQSASVGAHSTARNNMTAAHRSQLRVSHDQTLRGVGTAVTGEEIETIRDGYFAQLDDSQESGLIVNAGEIKDKWLSDTDSLLIQNLIRQDPETAAELLEDESNFANLNDRPKAKKDAEAGIKRRKTQIKAAKNERDMAQYSDFADRLFVEGHPDGPLTETDVLRSELGGTTKKTLYGILEDQADGKDLNKENFELTNWLAQRIIDKDHPDGHISSEAQLAVYLGRGLPWNKLQIFTNDMEARKKDPNRVEHDRMYNKWLKSVQDRVRLDTIGIESHIGNEKLQVFDLAKKVEFLERIKKGERPEDILSPNTKGHLASDIDAWAVTTQEVMSETSRGIQREAGPKAEPDDLEENLSEEVEQPDDPRAKRPGETTIEWVQRVQ